MPPISLSAAGLADQSPEKLNTALRRVLESMPARLYDADGGGLTAPEREALEQGGLVLDEQTGANPLAEGAVLYAAIIERSLTTKGVAKLLKVSEGRVRQMTADRSLYSFVLDGKRYVPDFQFGKGRLVPEIGKVNAVLPKDRHPVSIYRWYHLASADLVRDEEGVSPLDWLLAGLPVDEVISAASQL